METISQRELRNENAQVIRGVERGESYTITRHGVPIALLVPLHDHVDLRCVRPAKRRPEYAKSSRVELTRPSAEILDDLRGER